MAKTSPELTERLIRDVLGAKRRILARNPSWPTHEVSIRVLDDPRQDPWGAELRLMTAGDCLVMPRRYWNLLRDGVRCEQHPAYGRGWAIYGSPLYGHNLNEDSAYA